MIKPVLTDAKDHSHSRKEAPEGIRAGRFYLHKNRGRSRCFYKSWCETAIVIPEWDPVPVFIIKNNLKSAGISREEYFSLLDDI